ncbi:MAG: YgiT-type zinc finger protein [Candidatus Omnitrophica bacterium]|nr:YgiT-type zinc finger protein [Candidatus Omnitrophota bacterium]
MKNSLCAQCGGKLHQRKISLDRLVEGHLYFFENVSVQSCDQCGEIWIPGNLAERMDQALQGHLKPKKCITVPVY